MVSFYLVNPSLSYASKIGTCISMIWWKWEIIEADSSILVPLERRGRRAVERPQPDRAVSTHRDDARAVRREYCTPNPTLVPLEWRGGLLALERPQPNRA